MLYFALLKLCVALLENMVVVTELHYISGH